MQERSCIRRTGAAFFQMRKYNTQVSSGKRHFRAAWYPLSRATDRENPMKSDIREANGTDLDHGLLETLSSLAPFYERLGFRRHDVGMRLDLNTCYNTTGAAG